MLNDRILDGNGDCVATVDIGAYEFARPSTLSFSASSLSFADQDVGSTSAALSSTITSTGSVPVSVCGFLVAGDFGQINTCGASIGPKGTCAVNASFTPTSHGLRSGFLQLITNDAGSPQSVSLSGKGVLPGTVLSTTALNFPAQLVGTASAPQSVILSNPADRQLNLLQVGTTGDFSQSNTCGQTVAPLANCSFSITFTPTSSTTRTGSLIITDNASGSPHVVAFTGNGADFSLAAALGGSTAATVMAGNTATYNLQVSPLNGFAGTVALTCTGAPSLATCSSVPGTVTLNGSSSTSFQVKVTTVAPSNSAPSPVLPDLPGTYMQQSTLPMLLALVLFALPRTLTRAPSCKMSFTYALGLACIVSIAACGSGSNTSTHPGTPAGTFALTITASSGGVSHTQSRTHRSLGST